MFRFPYFVEVYEHFMTQTFLFCSLLFELQSIISRFQINVHVILKKKYFLKKCVLEKYRYEKLENIRANCTCIYFVDFSAKQFGIAKASIWKHFGLNELSGKASMEKNITVCKIVSNDIDLCWRNNWSN